MATAELELLEAPAVRAELDDTIVEDRSLDTTTADEDEDGSTATELDEGRALLLDTTGLDATWLVLFDNEDGRTMLELDERSALLLDTTEGDTSWLELVWALLDDVLLVWGADVIVRLDEGFADELLTALLVDDGAMVIVWVV